MIRMVLRGTLLSCRRWFCQAGLAHRNREGDSEGFHFGVARAPSKLRRRSSVGWHGRQCHSREGDFGGQLQLLPGTRAIWGGGRCLHAGVEAGTEGDRWRDCCCEGGFVGVGVLGGVTAVEVHRACQWTAVLLHARYRRVGMDCDNAKVRSRPQRGGIYIHRNEEEQKLT